MNNYLKENISQVRNAFSKYIKASKEKPVIVMERGEPKSVILNYKAYLKLIGEESIKEKSKKQSKKKRKFNSAKDFIGIGNPEGKKIDINKEIKDAWTKGY